MAYWTLKRQFRNGVPLLRRLQSQGQSHGGLNARSGIEGSPDTSELYQQLKYWQCLRQDLERARLLCELVRKREKYKSLQMKITEQIVMMELNPLEAAFAKLLDILETKDVAEIFLEPVDVTEVLDYMDVVKNPMDLSTMRLKIKTGMYSSLDKMEADFELMIKNCLAYNSKDTMFYRDGVKMREVGNNVFKIARKELEEQGLIEVRKTDHAIMDEIDTELKAILADKATEKLLTKLQILLEKANTIKSGLMRSKKVRTLRMEIAKAKKTATRESVAKEPQVTVLTESSQSDGEALAAEVKTPPCSPLKSTKSSGSPSGVNRRTAVLFTRKAQAALKKPIELQLKDENSSCDVPVASLANSTTKSPKRSGRTKRVSSRKSTEHETNPTLPAEKKSSPKKADESKKFDEIPDSFRVYRAQPNRDVSDSDDSNISYSDKKGFVNPKGFVYNGVPLPAPPQDVLNLRTNYSEFVYLVLFFDVKRTWQWLPSNKLELLGLDKQLDQSKLVESRKPTDKKAVKKAYHNALQYQSQVASANNITLGKVSK